MYDPRNANSVCIVGQFALVDLCDKIENSLGENIQLIQGNTDGILVKLTDESYYDKYVEVCKEWESRTGYTLEHDVYTKVIQKDVNNYIIVDKNNNVKSKGAYVKKLSKIDYDLEIVNRAIKNYFINDIPVEETINNCNDLISFQKICKIGSTYEYITHGDKKLNEKVIRVFACNKDIPGVFKMKKKINKDGIEVESLEKIANTPENCFIDNGDIKGKECPDYLDKQYYIEMAKKRIQDFIGKKVIDK